MKRHHTHFLFFLLICLTASTFNPTVASPPPFGENGSHFCGVIDHQPDNRRYARVRANLNGDVGADLNVGEPRTVRMIYFLPNDRPFRADVVQKMKDDIRSIQGFFAAQMQAHGYGNKTFRVETDPQGEPMVHRVDGQYPNSHYRNSGIAQGEIQQEFSGDETILFMVIDNGKGVIGTVRGWGGATGGNGGFAFVPSEYRWGTAAHELGHAFGLGHDFRDDAYIMSYGPEQNRLSTCHAKFLDVHPYFNPDIPIEVGQLPTIELISSPRYPAGSKSVPIQLKSSDSEGIHQVYLFVANPYSIFSEVKACRGFEGEKDVVVQFEYDGVIPSEGVMNLSNPQIVHPISVMVVDTNLNTASARFYLAAISPHHITMLEGGDTDWPTNAVASVSFSPDGAMLASGAADNTVRLWDVATRVNVATLKHTPLRHLGTLEDGYAREVTSVAFSPDGTTLASGSNSQDITVKLWDVATQQNIATLPGHVEGIYSVAFSPDGAKLASGSSDHTIKLWDVATQQNIDTLAHTSEVLSVSFSPDGTILAAGLALGPVNLWDVETKTNIATFEGHRSFVSSVSFSPDGTLLALGSGDGTIKIWDMATEANIATFEGHRSFVSSVSFSPDGTLLASGSGDGTIKIWDMATEANIATFTGHTEMVSSVSFSPDGTMLASGSRDGTIGLWDTSGLMQLRLEATAEINIPDPNLSAAIATALGKSPSSPIVRGHMMTLTGLLGAQYASISDLTGLEFATNLTSLRLGGNSISDISAVSGLTNLTELRLENNSISDISAVSGLTKLISLYLWGNSISDISAVSDLTNLRWLNLSDNSISDISAVSGLTKLTSLDLGYNSISDISAVSGLTNLTSLFLRYNSISDISSLVANTGLGSGDTVDVENNPLSYQSINTHIPTLQSRGVDVNFDDRTPTSLVKTSGDQHGSPAAPLPNPLVVEVQDENGEGFAGVPVTFAITAGGGTLSTQSTTTNSNGRAESTLTLGPNPGTNTVSVSAAEIEGAVTFTAVASEGVIIPDSNLRVAVRNALGMAPSDEITPADLATLTRLDANDAGISDLTGLEFATNLTWLDLWNNSISDISAVSGLTKLTDLSLSGNSISDISAVSGLTKLTSLDLWNNSISDISAVSGLTKLTDLSLSGNSISDISAVSGLTKLTSLNLENNSISDISAVSGLTKLTFLSLSGTSISDISAVSGLTKLTSLYLWGTSISDISAVSGLTKLTSLYLWSNSISDISAVSGLTKLTDLSLSSTSISDISAVSGLTKLTSLNLENNSISDISAVSGLTKLTSLGLGDNSISDISSLVANTGLGSGDRVYVLANPLSYQSINTHIPTLQSRGVTVEFDNRTPTTLLKISGDDQHGVSFAPLSNPLVVEVRDQYRSAFEGVPVTFTVTAGGGTLSTQSTTTDSNGREESVLTLGPDLGTNTVEVSVAGIEQKVTFNAIADNLPTEFLWSVPVGISLIHVPLKVTTVDGVPKTIESVGDLYYALGGASTVNLLITYDPKTQRWNSYIGPQHQDKPANKALTDDLGIIASMKASASVRLSGDALGTNGRSSITLHPGINLVGVPLRDSRIARVSTLLNLEGIRGNVSVIIVSDDGFKVVTQAGDDGDIPIMGGGSFILTAREAATVPISGTGWYNRLGPTAASPMVLRAIEVEDTTPVLAVSGSIGSPVGGASLPRPLGSGFQVTVKNLSTSKSVATVTEDEGVDYQLTFVNTETGRAAQVGDILEITAQSPDPFVGVQPLRYMVTPTDVKRNHIPLDELVAYEIPAETELLLNYPNPFNPETWIPYRLAEDAFVTLTIYDLSGGLVRRIDVGHRIAAVYESRAKAVHWDGRNQFGERVASGIYFYHFAAGDYSATRKMVILK